MHFEHEHYVRIYTRDTRTWLRWGWEGQAVFVLTARKFDVLGRLEVGSDPAGDLALITGLPAEVARVGLERILASGTFVLTESASVERVLECPNWIDGQTGSKSDSARAREYRARLKARRARDRAETPRASQSVTRASRNVTPASNPTQPNPDQIQPESALQDLTGCARVEGSGEARAQGGASRVYSLPSETPPEGYLEEAVMGGVSREQAASTWAHYWGAGLPAAGVERLHPWLVQRAKERQAQLARTPATAASSRAPTATPWEPNAKHRAYADKHALPLAELAERYRKSGEPEQRSHKDADLSFGRRLQLLVRGESDPVLGSLGKRRGAA